ncbi:capsular biosynthesis protein [Flammeovirga sp. MY04]|uniref:tyrosine-protein phosphatase n=1 Tax=Flammeovirga sp. MY04 TaxID=1191459 RepID=UPI0008063239|nr:CpsB/CapC family capsule biosynthesis tyrosine phosphatase [Flammeovirga sp. MY04]ANQ50588.1 capsular biosynthesis protein [Flammeovirga sp. MY04]
MKWLFKLFGKKDQSKNKEVIKEPMGPPITTDMHAHFLPGIDDGAQNIGESLAIIKSLHSMGYTKLVATPHVMSDFFKNTPEIIHKALEEVRTAVKEEGIAVDIDAAAEYYLDDVFIKKLRQGEKFLTFGDNYLLMETSFINPCIFIDEAIFLAISKGYKPVIAHPERYGYTYENNFDEIVRWKKLGALLQINALSLAGYYSSNAKRYAERLIDEGHVDFIGTDTHKAKHLHWLEKVRKLSYYNKALGLSLLNHSIKEVPQK